VASNFPTSLDNFTNPASGNTLDSPSHSLQHSDINDAVEALEAKLGIGASPAGSATSGYVLTAGTGGTTTWQALTTGKILQVVHATDGTVTSNSTTTYADSGLTASITPSSNTNKVLIIVTSPLEKTSGNASNGVKYRLLRDSSTTVWELRYILQTDTAIKNIGVISMVWLDSPSTTSSITYKTQLANEISASTIQDNPGGVTGSSIVLMEVKI
jgi:hypothetical protein